MNKAARSRQKQTVVRQHNIIAEFEHTQFVAHLSGKFAYNRNGDITFEIVVPYEFKELVNPLTYCFGIPLSFDVEVWEPYRDAV